MHLREECEGEPFAYRKGDICTMERHWRESVKYEAEERSREQNLVLLHRTLRDQISC